MFYIVLIVFSIYFVVTTLILFIFRKKVPKDTVVAFTGGLGSGKTLIGVSQSVKSYRRYLLLWRLGQLKDRDGKKVPIPLFYSNIPVKIKIPFYARKYFKGQLIKKKFVFAEKLKYEHILTVERVREYSVVFIDELGQFADQYSYDNPFVVVYLQSFIRFFRHFIDGRMFITDQSSSNVVVQIRRRLNVIYNLSEFRRVNFWFYKVKVDQMLITEDIMTIKESNQDDEQYFAGYVPFKFFRFLDFTRLFTYKKYVSRVYAPLYDNVLSSLDNETFGEYYTKYLIDIPKNEQLKKDYKKDGFVTRDKMIDFIEKNNKNFLE